MARHLPVRQYKVPFLHEKVIEEHAQLLLDEWAEMHPPIIEPPVPVEDILELHLELTFEISDLQSELGHPDVLGGIWFGDQMIKVDQSLDPAISPKMLGRYRFTLAHEVGHWRLHRQHLIEDPAAALLFQANGQPAFVCRSSQKPPEEWQADQFAGRVLMPRRLVYAAWHAWHGDNGPVVISELPIPDYHKETQRNENMAMEQFCKPLAERFEVSSEAMRIRLQQLELLVRERPQLLF